MAITVEELLERYPVLYHMASHGAWPMIQKHGLLSTERLVTLFEVPEPRRSLLLRTQRRASEPLHHPKHGDAVLRDQKPLSAKNLGRCLTDCDAPTWYGILNERVFFWLDPKRLLTLMSATEYAGKVHTILEIETAGIVKAHAERIELAHMNTGNTLPFPHPRGRTTFRRLQDYDYERRRRLANYSAVVELTVLGGVEDIKKHIIKVEHALSNNGCLKVKERLFQRQ